MRVIYVMIFTSLLIACNQQPGTQELNTTITDKALALKSFQYSKDFAKRFSLDQSLVNPDWNKSVAVSIERLKTPNKNKCFAKIYYNNSLIPHLMNKKNFISLQDYRYKEIFFFQSDLKDEDLKYIGDNALAAADKLLIHGLKNGKISASTGLSIDYMVNDFVPGMTYIKTLPTLCAVMEEPNLNYVLKINYQNRQLELPLM